MMNWLNKKTGGSNVPESGKGPDFSAVDQKKAHEMFLAGQLEKLYMHPLEFGGPDIPQNTLYVPIGIAGIKAGIDQNIIRNLLEQGTVSQYSVVPEYHATSFIPIRLKIRAYNPGDFTTEINIWGPALE